MMAHYRREGDVPELRANIDASRTRNNYSIRMYARGGRNEAGIVPGRGMATAETVAARVAAVEEKSGRKVRKDAVVLADLVVTLPRDVRDGDDKRFFKECVEYMASLVGMDNIVGAYVHMDEKTPHVHIAWTPVATKPNGKPSFSYKSMMTRGKYRALHKELAKRVEGKLGYPVEIELSEDRQKEKVLSSVPQDKLDAARAAIEAEYVQPALDKRDEIEAECARAAERLESLQREARMVEEEIECLDLRGEEIKARIGRIEEERRGVEEGAGREGGAARGRIEELERAVGEAREAVSESERRHKSAVEERRGIRERLRKISDLCGVLREKIADLAFQLIFAIHRNPAAAAWEPTEGERRGLSGWPLRIGMGRIVEVVSSTKYSHINLEYAMKLEETKYDNEIAERQEAEARAERREREARESRSYASPSYDYTPSYRPRRGRSR